MRLTPPQVAELRRLDWRGAQRTYGSARARVQGNLAALGCAVFTDERGRDCPRDEAELCKITAAGRQALRDYDGDADRKES